MNYQKEGDIDWCDATSNPITGCEHDCRWLMPDGTWIICYAKKIAENLASKQFPQGFEGYYWHPERLLEYLREKKPIRIFVGSMTDMFGIWVKREHVLAVMAACAEAKWHTFLTLTKNPKGMLEYTFPQNMWAGFSTPPDYMRGHELSLSQKEAKLEVDLETMLHLTGVTVQWASIEPLSWNVAPIFAKYGSQLRKMIQWSVIGAASDGPRKHQPHREHLESLLSVLDGQGIPVWYKGNLKKTPVRRELPATGAING